MANRLQRVGDIMMQRVGDIMMAGGVKLSGPSSGLCLQSEHLNITSQMNSGSRKRGFTDYSDSNGAKADEGLAGEGRTLLTPRPRGRPKGSRNKSIAPPLYSGIHVTPDTLKSHVFEIPSGVDVRMILETFAHRTRVGVFILSGSGTVTNVTLLQPAAPGGRVTYPGPLGIMSLSGMSLPTTEIQEATKITVILADAQGRISAGRVAGSLVASDRVTVVAAIAAEIPYERLNVQPVEAQSPGIFRSSALFAVQQHINMLPANRKVSFMSITNVAPNTLNLGTLQIGLSEDIYDLK